MESMKYIVAQVEDWDRVASAVAARLKPGMVIALSGPLGAGKTTFVQALSRVLGAKGLPRSPTFSLVRTYRLRPTTSHIHTLVHVDTYRIEDEKDVLPLGLDEYLGDAQSVVVIEWAERIPEFLRRSGAKILTMTIEAGADGIRRVDVRE